jgi:hypothetical protein
MPRRTGALSAISLQLSTKGIKNYGAADRIRFRRVISVLFAEQFTKKNICDISKNSFRNRY